MRIAVVAAALAAVLACRSRDPAPAAIPAAAAPPSATAAYVSAVGVLRREPVEAQRVAGGPTGKEIANYLATLQRGEKVSVLEARGDFARVRTSDDREGWLKRTGLLEGDGVAEATILQQADVFDRPDLLAANARRKLEPGTLLLVVRTKPPFSEVNVNGSQNAWVLSERLATSDRDVAVAKLVEKARFLKRAGKQDDARQILALARDHFAGAPLVDVLATEVGDVVPAASAPDAAAAPPAAAGPDGALAPAQQ